MIPGIALLKQVKMWWNMRTALPLGFKLLFSIRGCFGLLLFISSCSNEIEMTPEIIVERIVTPYKGNLLDIYFVDNNKGYILGEFDFSGNRK